MPARTRELVLDRALLAIERGRVLHALLLKPRHGALLGVRLGLLTRRGDRARVGRGERVRRLDAVDRSAEDGLRVRHVLARGPKVGVERAELWQVRSSQPEDASTRGKPRESWQYDALGQHRLCRRQTDLGVLVLRDLVPRFRVGLLAEDHVGRVAQVVASESERANDTSADGDAVQGRSCVRSASVLPTQRGRARGR